MKVFQVEAEGYPPMILTSINDFEDIEETLGRFLCLPGEEQGLVTGWKVTITVVEMTAQEIADLPEWEY